MPSACCDNSVKFDVRTKKNEKNKKESPNERMLPTRAFRGPNEKEKKDNPFISSKVISHLQYNVIYRQSDKYEI